MSNLFGEQLAQRGRSDQEMFEASMTDLAGVVTRSERGGAKVDADAWEALSAKDAVADIFSYLHIPLPQAPGDVTSLKDYLDMVLRPSGVMKRHVQLTGNWWTDAVGPMLAALADGRIVALLPKGRRYFYLDPDARRRVRVSRANAKALSGEAICFYRPFPQRKLGLQDLLLFIARSLSVSDYVLVVLSMLLMTFIGMITPYATAQLFGSVIPLGRAQMVLPVASMLVGAAVANMLFGVNDMILTSGVESKMDLQVHSAAMARLLSLPADFFRRCSAGEMSSKLESVSELCGKLREAVLGSGLSALFSFAYIFQMSAYAPSLALPAFLLMLISAAVNLTTAWVRIDYERKSLDAGAKLRGMHFSLFTGIQKIKLSGAEKRMFARWAGCYRKEAALNYRPPALIRLGPVISKIVEFGGLMLLYAFAATSGVSVGGYLAFYSAYGMASTAIMKLAGIVDTISDIKPSLEMVEPILKTCPETSDEGKIVSKLKGGVELNHVTFRYAPGGPDILRDLSLKIKPNEYVAIVGRTGCGKSTLLRLLLGFEKPTQGTILYDDMDMKTLDVRSLRQNIGVVLQDGKLFAGDIFANISVSAPWITKAQAMEAAEKAGILKDIERMPMGLGTLISEGSGGISGGQKQRLMIARAIAPKPRILMFDEATSALDNITQKQVSQSLDSLHCTRIVIAHRLSTIRHCDRILVLEDGRIAEEGNYDELVALGGRFAELVRRQIL